MKLRRIMIAGAAALAVCGVSGVVPGAAQASSASAATWTKQPYSVPGPAIREFAAMAYDAATGTVVLFGGSGGRTGYLGDPLDLGITRPGLSLVR